VTASSESKPANIAAAGAVSLSLLLAGADNALAMDAASMYKKVEPAREQKSRFAGTEAEALKNRKLGKTTAAPAVKASAPAAKSAAKPAAKKAAKKDTGGSSGALAAVALLGGVFAANATRGDDDGESEKKAAPKAAASGASDADANAADALMWIDEWMGAGGAAPDESTPEGRAASAQKWIDEWKKSQ
jgi:hypothetical protein